MDSTQLTVPARFVNTMLSIAADRNCDTNDLLTDVGIDPKDIDDNKPISVLMYGELHHHIIELVQDEWFGMLSGGQVPKGAIRLLCQSIVHCKNLEQAMIRTGEFFEICRGFKVKHCYRIEGQMVVSQVTKLDCVNTQEFQDLIDKTPNEVIKSTISVWHGFCSWLIGKYIPLNHVYYNFADDGSHPVDGQRASSHSKHKIEYLYSHDFIGYSFDKKFLSYPIVQSEDSVEDFMRKAPYYGLIKNDPNEGLAPYVKSLLAKSIGEELPNASEVADFFNISVTTLHRRLSNEGFSFQSLKNESRMEAAIHYLNCPDISTAAISDLLSFENPSTFYRSFKKWTGLPPGEYRKQLLAKNGS